MTVDKLFGLYSKAKEAANIINNGSSIKTRILNNIIIDDNKCWIWQRPLAKGYGNISYKDKTCRVHRVAYTIWKKEIPLNHDVDHLCGVKSCCNPEHLQIIKSNEHNTLENERGKLLGPNKGRVKNPPIHLTIQDRALWYKNTSEIINSCLKPNKLVTPDGYVNIRFLNKAYVLSRVILAIKLNKEYNDIEICRHLCHNRFCCNPDHLEERSVSQNSKDSLSYHKGVKLNIEKVKEIKILHKQGNPFKTKTEWDTYIGKLYNVTASCITGIRLNNKWKEVTI